MKKMKFLLAIIIIASISNLCMAQWSVLGNDVYNTNYNTTPPGKVGIGLIPIANGTNNITSLLQLKGVSANQPNYPGFQPVPFFTISSSNTSYTMDFGIGSSYGPFIRALGGPMNLEAASGVTILAGPAGSGGNLTVTGNTTIWNNATINNGILKIGNVTTPTGYKLYVQTGILTEKIKVATSTTTDWSDFVFDKTYKLRPLMELESYIKTNHHLPEIPSTEEVNENGVDLLEMDAKLLQKIEELTLYLIEVKKDNELLQKKITEMEVKLKQQ